MRVEYECQFNPYVQNRELLEITGTVFTEHPDSFFNRYNPDRAYSEFNHLSESAVNLWALQFKTAGEAISPASYSELQTLLQNLPARQFRISRAIISKIVSLTPPPPVPEPPPPTPGERGGQILAEKLDALLQFRDHYTRIKKDHPDLWQDTDGSRIDNVIDQLKAQIVGRIALWQK